MRGYISGRVVLKSILSTLGEKSCSFVPRYSGNPGFLGGWKYASDNKIGGGCSVRGPRIRHPPHGSSRRTWRRSQPDTARPRFGAIFRGNRWPQPPNGGARGQCARAALWISYLLTAAQHARASVDARSIRADLRNVQNLSLDPGQVSAAARVLYRRHYCVLFRLFAGTHCVQSTDYSPI